MDSRLRTAVTSSVPGAVTSTPATARTAETQARIAVRSQNSQNGWGRRLPMRSMNSRTRKKTRSRPVIVVSSALSESVGRRLSEGELDPGTGCSDIEVLLG
ncbi:hypothetical protein NLM24_38540 [Nocardia zapadnayensis]|nr:hypothetical protein [Nocardia zapadnayensis]MCX0276449.1 hypothetical protein [Nocardia zapadnayensis]